nr:MAG TPA: hypothetical protein [Caudoviricetes sp.]
MIFIGPFTISEHSNSYRRGVFFFSFSLCNIFLGHELVDSNSFSSV